LIVRIKTIKLKDMISKERLIKALGVFEGKLLDVKDDVELSFTDAYTWTKMQHQIEAKIQLIKELLQ